jgi:hypothetical protein
MTSSTARSSVTFRQGAEAGIFLSGGLGSISVAAGAAESARRAKPATGAVTRISGPHATNSSVRWPLHAVLASPQLLLGFDEAGTAANARTDGKGRRTDPQPLETAEIRLGSRVLLYRLLSAAGADPELVVGFRE